MTSGKLGVAVVGAGYWGPNLVRNFRSSSDWELVAVCDLDVNRARALVDVEIVEHPRRREPQRRPGRIELREADGAQ